MPKPPQMLSLKEAATRSGLSVSMIRSLIRSGKIPYINTGRKHYINWERFMEYLAQGETATVSPAKPKEPEKQSSISKRFKPPTVEEVAEYCQQRSNGIDAQRFVDFYTAKGWKIGSTSMKDWRAAIRTWEQRQQSKNKTAASTDQDLLRIFNGE